MLQLCSPGAKRCARLLAERKERVATIEATSAGLIGASLVSCPGASRFFISSAVVYSGRGYKQFLPKEVLERSGVWDRENNYSNREKYIESKRLFVQVCAELMKKETRADWMIVESGTSGPEFYVPGVKQGFTAIGIADPHGRVYVEVFETGTKNRDANMVTFTQRALEMFEKILKQTPQSNSKL